MPNVRYITLSHPVERVVVPAEEGELVMSSGVVDVDLIEELKMRRWARENYVPQEKRPRTWHPVVHEEMQRKDHEAGSPLANPKYVSRVR